MIGNHRLLGPVTVDWDTGDGPNDVWWRRVTLADWGRHEQAKAISEAEAALVAIINRARDSEGRRLFKDSPQDRRKINNDYDAQAVAALYNAISESDLEIAANP